MEIRNGAAHMPSLHAIITSTEESTDLVEAASQPHLALRPVPQIPESLILLISGTLIQSTESPQTKQRFRLRS